MTVRIGVDGLKFPDATNRGAGSILREAHALGMDGVFFRSVLEISPALDSGACREVREEADRLGMYLEAGLGKLNPYASAESPALRAAGDGDIALACRRLMEAAAAIECREMWVGLANKKPQYPGRLAYDRFRTDVTWPEQLAATQRFLTGLAPVARDLGIHMNIETHEEVTSFEVVRLVEAVGPDVTGVVFDTSNGLQRLEHPTTAAARVAPYTRQTHFKDALLTRTAGGLRYQVRPCGEGVIDFAAVLGVLRARQPGVHLTLETRPPVQDHAAPAGLPTVVEVDDPGFRAAHPDLDPAELAAYLELVRTGDQKVSNGELMDPETYDGLPYGAADATASMVRGAAHLRSCLAGGPR